MVKLDFCSGPNSSRLRRLLLEAINRLELNLKGARVLTEAASFEYAITPVIAAAAGAEVFALTRDSAYASVAEVHRHVMTAAEVMSVEQDRIQVVTERAAIPAGLDIITNLGFVRPIDKTLLNLLSASGVVSYMSEAWEMRDGDVDLATCQSRGVPVAGVWEDFEGLDIFRSCGQLAVKLCFDAGLEVAGNCFTLITSDRFGPVIAAALEANLARVNRLASAAELTEALVANADAVIVADYSKEDTVLGKGCGPTAAQLYRWNPGLLVIQFAGRCDVTALAEAGLHLFPARELQARRMAFTLAHLGVRPTLLLHSAGLKVGELLWRARSGYAVPDQFRSLVQPMNETAGTLF